MHHSKLYFADSCNTKCIRSDFQRHRRNQSHLTQPIQSSVTKKDNPAIVNAESQIKRGAHWERVAGCARDIAAGKTAWCT